MYMLAPGDDWMFSEYFWCWTGHGRGRRRRRKIMTMTVARYDTERYFRLEPGLFYMLAVKTTVTLSHSHTVTQSVTGV